MKIRAFIKLSIKSTIKNFLPIVLRFAIFPIFLGLVIGYFQKDEFTPSVEMPVMSINIVDEDNSTESDNLKQFLQSDQMKKIIDIKEDEEDAKYELTIPNGYQDSLLLLKESPIKVDTKEDGSFRMGTMLGSIIDEYNEEVSQNVYINKNIDKKDISSKEKQQILNNISNEIYQIYNTNPIKNTFINTKKSLSAYEHTSITFLSYLMMIIIISIVAGEDLQKENGIYSRVMSTSMTKIEYFNYNLIDNYLFVVFLNLLYVFVYRVFGLSFNGSIPLLILIVLAQSLLVVVLVGLVLVFLKKKIANLFLGILMMFQLIIGVNYAGFQKMNNSFLAKLSNFTPDVLIIKAYRNYLIYNNFDSIKFYLLSILLVSVIIYIVSLVKVKFKRGEA